MISLSPALKDLDLGFTAFSVLRSTYRRQNGSSVASDQTLPASSSIHPGTPEMLQLLPEEERHEEFIAVYTDFPLSLGENGGGAEYSVPDRIRYPRRSLGRISNLLKVRSGFGNSDQRKGAG